VTPSRRWLLYLALGLTGIGFLAAAFAGMVVLFAYPKLPSLDALTDYRPKQPLRVFTADGYQIGEFGEERRTFVPIQEVPAVMKNAILAAEDERFYQHGGVDSLGVLRAAVANLTSGGKRQGASTITMQVARNFFLSREKTLNRKVLEVLLSFKIEHNLTKDQILELYINQIYLGQRSYGFASAAQIYFGKSLKELSAAEAAMLAGLPKAPSSYNPVANPKRARIRQLYVLRRMGELGFLDTRQHEDAEKEQLHVKRDPNEFSVHADYVAEMARQIAVEQFPEDVYNRGLKVITTITRSDQEAAFAALRQGVLDYDRRHGYRGAESYVNMADIKSDQDEALDEALQEVPSAGDLIPAVVLALDARSLRAYRQGGEVVTLSGEGLKFAQSMLGDKAVPNKRLRRGAIIRIRKDAKGPWQIAQLPEVEAAFVSADSADGAIRSLVGGFDFNRNKFNHVTQAWRQPGSSFKPFIYSAALEKGYSPASVMEDAPITISSGETGSQAWTPHNYDGKYEGSMTLRMALAKSKNMVSIRLLRSIGATYGQDYVTRFGFEAEKHPPYLTMALGAGSVTPWQQLTAYTIFANGGFRIQPYIVKRIEDAKGVVLAQAQPRQAGDETVRVIDPRNGYLMDSMLRDVVIRGTAAKAHVALKRNDLAGKTGTTNDYVDAWFCGYHPSLVGIAWVGFDQPKRLGNGETGGAAALPMWISYMEKALASVPEAAPSVPTGLIPIRPAGEGASHGGEMIYQENLPPPPLDKPDSAYAPASEGE